MSNETNTVKILDKKPERRVVVVDLKTAEALSKDHANAERLLNSWFGN